MDVLFFGVFAPLTGRFEEGEEEEEDWESTKCTKTTNNLFFFFSNYPLTLLASEQAPFSPK